MRKQWIPGPLFLWSGYEAMTPPSYIPNIIAGEYRCGCNESRPGRGRTGVVCKTASRKNNT